MAFHPRISKSFTDNDEELQSPLKWVDAAAFWLLIGRVRSHRALSVREPRNLGALSPILLLVCASLGHYTLVYLGALSRVLNFCRATLLSILSIWVCFTLPKRSERAFAQRAVKCRANAERTTAAPTSRGKLGSCQGVQVQQAPHVSPHVSPKTLFLKQITGPRDHTKPRLWFGQ